MPTSPSFPATPSRSSSRAVLVLGGTGWLGGLITTQLLDSGWSVTCLARGISGAVPAGAELVAADRDDPEALAPLSSGTWQAVVDLTRHLGHAQAAATSLAGSAQLCAYVSSCSAYRDHAIPGADESAPLLPPLESQRLADPADYGAAKVACEMAWSRAFGPARSVIIRPGLIAGPGDTSDRTGYWPSRMAAPADPDGATVLVPEAVGQSAQVVDARDLATWVALLVDRGQPGSYDAVGLPLPLAEHLTTAWDAAGRRARTLPVPDSWLLAQGVAPWAGSRSLPLWLPDPAMAGFAARSGQAARDAGLSLRPLVNTLSDTLTWERTRARPQVRRAGLTPADELALIQAWRAS